MIAAPVIACMCLLIVGVTGQVMQYPIIRRISHSNTASLQRLQALLPNGFRIVRDRQVTSSGPFGFSQGGVTFGLTGAGLNGLAGIGIGGVIGAGGLVGGTVGGVASPIVLDSGDLPDSPSVADSDITFVPRGSVRTLQDAARIRQLVDTDSLIIG